MTQKTAIKYLILNVICLILFSLTKELYLSNSIQANILYSVPSLLGSICLTSLPIPILFYFKGKRQWLFIGYLLLTTLVLVLDEYSTLFSNNEYFDFMDIYAIILGTEITFLLFQSNLKQINYDRK